MTHGAEHLKILIISSSRDGTNRVKWVPVTTAWRVLGLGMEERPPDMEGSCKYIE